MKSPAAQPKAGRHTNLSTALDLVCKDYIAGMDRMPRDFARFPIRGMILYILTDGIWKGETGKQEVEDKIRMFLKLLSESGVGNVGIQFITFGEELDHFTQADGKPPSTINPVDTEPARGNVYKMLLGSMLRDQETFPLPPVRLGQSFDSYAKASGRRGPPQTQPGSSRSSSSSSSIPSIFATSIFSDSSRTPMFRPESPPTDGDSDSEEHLGKGIGKKK